MGIFRTLDDITESDYVRGVDEGKANRIGLNIILQVKVWSLEATKQTHRRAKLAEFAEL